MHKWVSRKDMLGGVKKIKKNEKRLVNMYFIYRAVPKLLAKRFHSFLFNWVAIKSMLKQSFEIMDSAQVFNSKRFHSFWSSWVSSLWNTAHCSIEPAISKHDEKYINFLKSNMILNKKNYEAVLQV